VWHAWWGGGGEPCTTESGGGGSQHRVAAAEEETAVEAVVETGVDGSRGDLRRAVSRRLAGT
jgi:hypothetical protein